MINLDSILKSRDITLPIKVHLVKAVVFPVVMYGCESWSIRKLSTKDLMLSNCGAREKTLQNSLDCKEIKPVSPKGNQPWIFIGRTEAEAEAPIFFSLFLFFNFTILYWFCHISTWIRHRCTPDAKTNSWEKTLMLRKIEDKCSSV